jgi:hypothetical protein
LSLLFFLSSLFFSLSFSSFLLFSLTICRTRHFARYSSIDWPITATPNLRCYANISVWSF